MQTFYWHDYETWGTRPAIDRPAQFAGLRTDAEFNIVGDPLVIYCQPPVDVLPEPEACLITGITPQLAQERGLPEYRFVEAIHRELAQPGTCGVGYNSLRFDDEVTRYALYRNFYDPYAREWQNGNSRWDLIDLVRACRTLRPDGIEWPHHADGSPSFKLEHLTAANGLAHEAAHDALSDVEATIAVARLLRARQPRLFDYCLQMRSKRAVAALLDVEQRRPVLHFSGRIAAARGCGTLVVPLARHPVNANGVICYDLAADPAPLLELDAKAIRARLFASTEVLAEQGLERVPLKTIHLNRCPIVATAALLDDAVAARMQLDRAQCEAHYRRLYHADLAEKLRAVFTEPDREALATALPERDAESMLYAGFVDEADRRLMATVRASAPDQLTAERFAFRDPRLRALLWRYRARNHPEKLTAAERQAWRDFCRQRLQPAENDYRARLEQLRAAEDAARAPLLQALESHLNDLLAACDASADPAQPQAVSNSME